MNIHSPRYHSDCQIDHSLHTKICAPLTQDYAPFYSNYNFDDELKGDLVTEGYTVSQQQRLSVKALSELLPINAILMRFYSLFYVLSRV